ncbi:site-specific integrase [Vibrio parahaemolyticus]|uniref:site-specific integrase n=1 Tax=Vibrio parahaemolyticus TaxID=670 RepID=UPI0015DDFFA7|nr:site-specific integrase [Vibrio parahaemolyticus]
MYLTKNRNSNYYTRMSLPSRLKTLGYPSEIRFSLHTKDRSEAVDRSIMVLAIARPWISAQTASDAPEQSTQALKSSIRNLQQSHFIARSTPIKLNKQAKASPRTKSSPPRPNIAYLEDFLAWKEKEGIRYSSISLLRTRIRHFISLLKTPLKRLSTTDAVMFEDTLLSMDNSYKTKKEYLSAAKQFCEWLRRKQVIKINPLKPITIKVPSNARLKPSSQRTRWTKKQLDVLFKHVNFAKTPNFVTATQAQKEDFWIPLLALYTGARSGEICQLKASDIHQKEGIWCIDINDKGTNRHLKSVYANRLIPIHSRLIKLGFLDYVSERDNRRQVNLFSFTPIGIDNDWSKTFASRFSKVLKQCGFTQGKRPTLHSFRHTFIDELQQVGVEEHVTCELVGHSKSSLTYGRYGKRLNISLLSQSIEKIHYLELESIDSRK